MLLTTTLQDDERAEAPGPRPFTQPTNGRPSQRNKANVAALTTLALNVMSNDELVMVILDAELTLISAGMRERLRFYSQETLRRLAHIACRLARARKLNCRDIR